MANNVRSFLGGKRYRERFGEAGPRIFTADDQNTGWAPITLKGGSLEAGPFLELIPVPVALWSRDRRVCVFNKATRDLLGFCEHDFLENSGVWLQRTHSRDRAELIAEWRKLQHGDKKISCSYRFLPKGRSTPIRLKEVSVSYPIPGDPLAVWSLYTEEPNVEDEYGGVQQVRDLVRGLTHEIGNSLQTISGELDLLRLSGALSPESSTAVTHGVSQIRKLAHEIEEYLSPPPRHLRTEDPASVLKEVIQSREAELVAQGIQIGVVLRQPLPKVPLDEQFRSALERVIDFSCALLPRGGELNIEAGVQPASDGDYIELNLITASPTSITVEEKDVFRPFLKLNGCRVGLSMAMARQILRRHFGKIVFRKEGCDQGVFSILIKVPSHAS